MKVKLRCWLVNHEGQGWSDELPDIALGMNRQSHSSLGGKMPYEIFFNRKPRWEDRVVVGTDVQVDQIEDEALGDQVGPIYYPPIIFLTLPRHHLKAQHPHHQAAQHPQHQAAWGSAAPVDPPLPLPHSSSIPIDPAILEPIAAATPSIVLTEAEESILSAAQKACDGMANRYA